MLSLAQSFSQWFNRHRPLSSPDIKLLLDPEGYLERVLWLVLRSAFEAGYRRGIAVETALRASPPAATVASGAICLSCAGTGQRVSAVPGCPSCAGTGRVPISPASGQTL